MKFAFAIAGLILPVAALAQAQAQQPAPTQPSSAQASAQAPAEAQPAAPAAAAPTPAAAADLVAGATVHGPDGSVVGRIEEPDAEGAVVTTGSARARLPLNNFLKGEKGLMISVNRAQFEAAVGGSPS